jgi:hypothetical protein
LNLLEFYYSVQKKFDDEKITLFLLKTLPHVISSCEGYWERYTIDESTPFERETTWEYVLDTIKEDSYLIESYDDQCMRWMDLC